MRYFLPDRRTAGGTLKIELQDSKPGDYELLSEKYFKSIDKIRDELEVNLGTLRLSDVNFDIVDLDRKFRDGILTPDELVLLKLSYEERQLSYIAPKAIDLDGSTEYLTNSSSDFDMNGPEEITNTGFEVDTAGWALNGKSSRDNARAHSGTWSLQDQGGGTPNYNEYSFASNRLFQATAEAWVYIDSAPPGGNATLQLLDASNNVLASRNANNGTVGSWQKLVLNLDTLLVRKIRLVNSTTITVHWDDISLTRAWDFTVALWFKSVSPGNPSIVYSKGAASSGLNSGVEIKVRNTHGKMEVTVGDGANFANPGLPSVIVADTGFHLLIVTCDRDGNCSNSADAIAGTPASLANVGNINSSQALSVGSRVGSFYAGGLLGEIMIIKGWAADAVTIGDWFANGLKARSDTIGFWRWQHPTDVGKDYSGKNHSLVPVNVDSNDIKRDEPRGLFAPYKQIAQVNESLFFGMVKQRSAGNDEKRNIVALTGYSALKALEGKTIDDLRNAIQDAAYEENKHIFFPLVSGDPIYPPGVRFGKAVRLTNVLRALGNLVKCPMLETEMAWAFGVEAGGLFPKRFNFEDLYVVTQGGSLPGFPLDEKGILDADTVRSPLSWQNLYGNCLELLKSIQLAFFAFARTYYRSDASSGILWLKQRGLPNDSTVSPAGKLLEYGREFVTNNGVLIRNRYTPQDPPYQGPTPVEMQTQYGTAEFELDLPIKLFERRLVDFSYTYLYAAWNPSTNEELVSNGDFEVNTAGWTLNGASSRDNTRANTGAWSLKDAGGTGTYNEWIIPFDLADDLIEFSASVWPSVGSSGVKVELIGVNGVLLATLRPAVNGQWSTWELNYNAFGIKKIRLYGNSSANPVWWDSITARAVVPGHLDQGIFICNKVYPHGWPLNGVERPNLHAALANAYGISSVGKKDIEVRTFHRPIVVKDGSASMKHAGTMEVESFPYKDEVMNLDIVRTEFDIEKNVMIRAGIRR